MKKKHLVSVYKGSVRSKYSPDDKFLRRMTGKAYTHRVKSFFNQRTFAGSQPVSNTGFTLIELLVVIGIIAILASVVIVAINPARQFALARDTERTANVAAILNAVDEDMSEHGGVIACPNSPNGVLTLGSTPMDIASSDGTDVATCVVPDYIASMPFDPIHGNYASTTDYDTKYTIVQDPSGHITISSNGELTNPISVTR